MKGPSAHSYESDMRDKSTSAHSINIAFFITSHGFGHAARAAAVMNAIHERWSFVHFDLFTEVPEWFFSESLDAVFTYHRLKTDIGLVQSSPLTMDLPRTIAALDAFLPFQEQQVGELSKTLIERECLLVLCDISPLGISVGQRAGITTILIENFTWDWIYQAYQASFPRFEYHCNLLADIFFTANQRIQAGPVCVPQPASFRVPPIARRPRQTIAETRERLGISNEDRMVLITMGGIPERFRSIDKLSHFDADIQFVIPGPFHDIPLEGEKTGHVTLLPHASMYYHPDLVQAANAVIGKIGYSTLAEVYHAGVPFGYITRDDFAEAEILTDFVRHHMAGFPVSADAFQAATWLDTIEELLSMSSPRQKSPDGARIAAKHICGVLNAEKELLDIVNTEGAVIGAAARKSVHGNNQLLHRVVHVLVFDSKQRLLLQKRSLDKPVAPGKWDTSVGGHVDRGETLSLAAQREMKEELGIGDQQLRYAYHYIHTNDFESELVTTYICHFDGPFHHDPDEIDAVKFWDMGEIEAHLNTGLLSDNFKDEFQRFKSWNDRTK